MNTKIKIYCFIIIFPLCFAVVFLKSSWGGVIFEDNFNKYGDWSSDTSYGTTEIYQTTKNKVFGGTRTISTKGWDSYRTDSENLIGNPTFQLNSTTARGGSGKSLKVWYESIDSAVGGGLNLWIGGGAGASRTDQEKTGYDEIYVRAAFKFDPNWTATSGGMYLKLFRMYTGKAIDYGDNPSTEWNDTNTAGICQWVYLIAQRDGNGYYKPGWGIRGGDDPNLGGNACIVPFKGSAGAPSFNQYMSKWIIFQVNAKLNTPGKSDGVLRLWINNNDPNNPDWVVSGLNIRTTADRKFNTLVFLDNLQHYFASPRTEQYLAMDDLVVSTSFVDSSYVIGDGVSLPDTTAPTTTASPGSGTYLSARSVNLSTDESAITYYTLDGSKPTTFSAVYSSAISISQNATLKFFSVDTAGNKEQVKTATYTISPASGSAAYFKFDSNFSDSGPNNLSAAGYGGAGFVPGKLNQAANFDGVDDYVQVNDNSKINFGIGDEFTIALWLKGSNATQTQMIFSKANGSGYQLVYNPSNQKLLFRINEGGILINTYSNVTNVLDGQWHHIVVGRSQGQHFIYIDGNLDATTADTVLPSIANSVPLYIGSEAGGSLYAGLIDEMRIYSRALSSSEVHDLFNISGQDHIPPAAPTLQ